MPLAYRALGLALVTLAVLVLFLAVAPLGRLALDYDKRLGRIHLFNHGFHAKRLGAGQGFETLPPLVQAMSALLVRERIDVYWVSPDLLSSGQLWQRIVEGNWPRIPRSNAHAVFGPIGQPAASHCRAIPMATVGYQLVVCP